MKMKPTDTAQSTCPSNDLHFRIYTFGSFHIDWVDPSTGQILPLPPERLQGQNAGSALGLLKALLGCPDRFATRSWLQEQFWPTSRQQSATERLHDVTSALRGLLRPAGSKAMLVHYIYGTDGQGAGYQLDALPRIWCDAHAFEWYVKHGMLLDQRGQDSTACWERAFQLMERGMYLPEYLYDDWASKRREVLSGLMRDCVQRWTLLLRQAGHVDEAIMRMRSYWLAHRTDEDALRPLLEMLGERERFQEAEECYAKAQAEVEEDGHKLHERTQETLEVVRALQIQRIPSFKSPVAIVRLSTSTLSCSSLPSEDIIPERVISQPLPLESSALTNVFDRATQFMVTIFGLANRWQGRAAHCNDLQVLLSQEFAMFEQDASQPNAGEQHALSRRQALVAIAALPYGALAAARHAGVGLQPEEFLPQSTAAITSCWSIMQNREFTVVEEALSHCLPALTTLAQQSSPYQQAAAGLAAQSNLLLGLIALHQQPSPQNFRQRLLYCKQAAEQTEHVADPTLRILALTHVGATEGDLGQFPAMVAAHEEAVRLSDHELVLPTLRRKAFARLAWAYARAGQSQQALRYNGEVKTSLPSVSEQVPAYLQDSGLFCEGLTEAQMFGDLGKQGDGKNSYQLGLKAIEQAESLLPTLVVPERFRLEGINQKALLALRLGDLDLFRDLSIQGVQGAKNLKSGKRLQEIITNWKEARKVWPSEPRVMELADLLLE